MTRIFSFPLLRCMRNTLPLLLAVPCLGCGEEPPPPPPVPIELTAEITAAGEVDPSATVHLSVHHAWTGTGELRYPLEIIERFETKLGTSNLQFDYPVEAGEGLVVYAWVDTDGDGVHCTPTFRGDLADLAEIDEFPSKQVLVSLVLEVPCAGPDWFFPGPEPG